MFTGFAAVTTRAPERIEVSAPCVTVTFFGPSVEVPATDISILALVDATDEIRSPKQFVVTVALHAPEGIPRKMPGDEGLNETPAVIASPPSVKTELSPDANRTPKAGRVRFNVVAFGGKAWISAVTVPFALTVMEDASARAATSPK